MTTMVLLNLSGCKPVTANASDPSEAMQVLDEALASWKSGKSADDMREVSPPTYVADDSWETQQLLVDYSYKGEPVMIGTNVCIDTVLKVKDSGGRVLEKPIRYLVTTTPARTISRLDQ